jgi:hypothetical protein
VLSWAQSIDQVPVSADFLAYLIRPQFKASETRSAPLHDLVSCKQIRDLSVDMACVGLGRSVLLGRIRQQDAYP